MVEKEDRIYLRHILEAIVAIEKYLQGMTRRQFASRPMVQDAIIRQVEIIGEATKHLSATLRKNHGDVPWKDMAGMRDKLIHAYFDVDTTAVWDTANDDLPAVKAMIAAMLHQRTPTRNKK